MTAIKNPENRIINNTQFRLLEGFFVHLWNANFKGTDFDGGFWSDELDRNGIAWSVQNTVSYLANERNNAFLYFRSSLKASGITVEASAPAVDAA